MMLRLAPIDELDISADAKAFLTLNGVYYIPDAIQRTRTELLAMSGANADLVLEIDLALRRKGLLLGSGLKSWPPKTLG